MEGLRVGAAAHAEPEASVTFMDQATLPPADQALVDIAEYAAHHPVASDAARDMACHCFMEALAGGFRALRDPDCARLLGPVVPGATMTHGARVPGTSFELDPVMAAFNIGALVCWERDPAPQTSARPADALHPCDQVGGILAVGDYLARKAHNEGRKPLVIGDLLTALVKAHEIQGLLALDQAMQQAALDPLILVRVASTAMVTALLGGSRDQILDAVSHAWIDGVPPGTFRHAPTSSSRKRWAAADAGSRAVRLAFMALAGEKGYPSALSAPGWGLHHALFKAEAPSPARPYASVMMDRLCAEGVAGPLPWPSDNFADSVAAHFCAAQAALIQSRCADRARFMLLPVNEFAALLVKNG
jgi:2-methylcitrate dehydratase